VKILTEYFRRREQLSISVKLNDFENGFTPDEKQLIESFFINSHVTMNITNREGLNAISEFYNRTNNEMVPSLSAWLAHQKIESLKNIQVILISETVLRTFDATEKTAHPF
jgi:hypothetical protein